MTASVIDGKKIAAKIIARIADETEKFLAKTGVRPGIAVVIVGEDPASQVYVRSKGKRALECGFHSIIHKMSEETAEEKILELIDELNNDESIHAILVQLPLPRHINEGKIIQAISPDKDVDGFHFINIGKLGAGEVETAFVPCTPSGCIALLKQTLAKDDFSGLNAVVVGRSNIVGKPVANLLLAANATVTIAHSRTKDLPSIIGGADILVAAVGRSEMIRGDWIKLGAVVIDVGINRIPAPEKGEGKTRLTGDVAYDECVQVASAITPVPGGVGPMTIAMLMTNTLKSAFRKTGLEHSPF